MANYKPEGSAGQRSGWADSDDAGEKPHGSGIDPVKYLDDAPDDLWRDALLWFFLPSIVVVLSVWIWMDGWLNLPTWTGWAFIAGDLAAYVVIGWRGPQLLSFARRLLGRQKGPN